MSAPRLTLCLVLIVAFLATCLTLARPARAQEIGWASESVPAKTIAVEEALTSSWSPLVDGNELNDGLYSLVLDDAGRALYAAGRFTSAGGVSANHIAKWNRGLVSPGQRDDE